MKMFVRTVIAAAAVLACATPAAAQGDKKLDLRVQFGGVFLGGGSGFIVGGGVAARPFTNQQIETNADLSLLRFEGYNGFLLSGNVLYYFTTNEPNFKPFAGGGLGIRNFAGHTEARLQVGGGLEFNANSRNPIRPELRFIFTDHDTTTIILVSIGVGRR